SYPAVDYQAAFLMSDATDLDYHKKVIKSGLQLFEKLLGYKAVFFVPPNGMINNSLNEILAEGGIELRYVAKIQHESMGSGRYRKRLHYLGQKDKHGIRYIIRNCFFEPSQDGHDWVDVCLNQIRTAFRLKKPAIIGTHRVNYIGSLNPKNRDTGLSQLSSLLTRIKGQWPDVEFLTTARLGDQMKQE
ncbi:MAG: polysaccharide (de)acetylase, partial [Bacteroidota bacterium]|nr:polysaccharide (de)acetylase [Bacteroidota bacterium]